MIQLPLTLINNVISRKLSIEFSIWERKLLLVVVDSLILFFSLFFYYQIDDANLSPQNFLLNNFLGLSYGLVLFAVLSNIFNLYDLAFVNITRKILPLVFFIGTLVTTIFVLTPILTPSLPDQRLIIIGFIFGFTAALALWRIFYIYFIHTPAFFKEIIVLASEDFTEESIKEMKRKIEGDEYNNGYRIRRFYFIPKGVKSEKGFERMLDKIITSKLVDSIIVLNNDHEDIPVGINKLLTKSIQKGIDVKTYLRLYEEIEEAMPLNLAGREFYNIFPISRFNANFLYKLWSRLNDVLAAFLGLSFVILIVPFITVINMFINKGPLFYSQLRVGKGGKEYKMIKFRSMVTDAEKQGAKMSVKGDARITGFGKILRKARIDELPQFWNVLIGDMSLIGPRPERKVFVDQLSEDIPFYNARHLIKPGITGWAQVKYPYGENLEDSYNKLEYDLFYIKNRSITQDIRIIIKTINSVIFSKGQ